MNNLITTIAVVFLLIDFSFAQKQEPVIVSPIIGEKLDRVEEDYFRLIPAITNVQEAIFYLNPDSSLNVFVIYEDDDVVKDTFLVNYISLIRLRDHIDYQLNQGIKVDKKIEGGKYVSVLTNIDSVDGELLNVNNSSIILLKLSAIDYHKDYHPPFDVRYIDGQNVNKVIVYNAYNAAKFIYPTILGLGLGITAGIIADNNTENVASNWSEGINLGITPILYAMLGGLVGGLIGYGLSYIFPIISISETEFDIPFNEDDIIGLRNLSRYK